MKQDISADHGAGGADAVDPVDGTPGADEGAPGLIQLAAAVIPQPPVILAQAGAIGAQPQGPYVPMLAPGAAFTTAGPTTAYAIGVDGTVHLPAGTTVAMAQVVGNDLHFVQPDGTLIVIVGGGIAIPLIFIGGVAFNPDVIAALIGLGQVQPAAAPAAAPGGVGGSAGGEFGQPAGPIDPNAINLTDLLPPTALQFGIPEVEEIGFALDTDPTVSENPSVIVDDDDLAGGNAGGVGDNASTNLSGVLAHDFGDNQPGTIGFLTSGAPAGFSYELSGTSLLILQDGTLVLTVTLNPATGAYTVIQNNPIHHTAGENENNQDFTLTYRVSDSDGDFVDGTLNVSVDDDTPTVVATATAVVDDDNLAGGNPGGVGDDDPASVSGTLGHSFGADGGSIAFLATGAPAGFTYETSGSSLLIKQGATLVLTITLNTATGAYSVIQNAPIDHAAGDNENNQAFTIGYRVTDGDGDTVDGSLSLSVDDDTPTVTSNTIAVLDDDQFAGGNPGGPGDDAIANTSGNIGYSFGADGSGSAAFLATGAPAGFTYELSGGSLLIKQGATTVLTVTLNNETGAYTVTQNAVIDHAAGGEENNSLFTLTYRVTDADGDVVDGTLTISVDDDTPTITSNGGVVVDEDDLSSGNGDSAPGDDAPANVTGTLGHSFGADGAGGIALLASGAPAGFTYTLSGGGTILTISQNSSDTDVLRITVNATTGAYEVELLYPLDHPTSGTEDNLPFTINYSVTDADGDSTNGTLSISVDDDSPTSGGQQPRPISATVLEDGMALATGDLSDGNREGGETTADDEASGASGSLTGVFSVGADQPLTVTLSNDTSGLPTLYSKGDAITYSVSGNVLTATADAGGPDQRVVFTLTVNPEGSWYFDLKDQLDHVDNGLNDENFALRTNAAGTTSVGAIDFSSVILGTDSDGDTAPATAGSFTVAVQDDVPTGMVSGTVSVHVDEDNLSTGAGDLSNGINDGDADTDEATFSSASLATILTPGADEPVILSVNGSVSGAVKTSGGADVTSQGVTVKWAVVDATHAIGFADTNGNGIQDGGEREVFRLTDNGNGSVTFDLKDQIDHAPASGEEAVLTLDLTVAFSVTDYDGDEVALGSGTITVEVENDVPAAAGSATASIRVEEDELSTGSGDLSNGITDGDAFGDEATFSTASLAALVTPGADEPLDFNLNTALSGNVVTTGGAAVLSQGANVLWGTNAGALVGFVNLGGGAGFDLGIDREVFRVTDNGNGTFTFDLKDQLDHAAAAGDNGILTLDLTSAFSATDYDGDAVTLNADSITVVVENDVPAAAGSATASVRVEEDELSTGSGDLSNGITDGDAFGDEATFSTASLAALATPGADEPLDFNLNSGVSGNVVTTGGAAVLSQGANVLWGTNAGALVGFVNLGGGAGFDLGIDREVFRVTDNGNGTFTFDLKDQLDHAAAAGDNGILTLDLTSAFSATDFDGDAVTLNPDSITVVVENDVPQPVTSATASVRVEEDELSTGSGDLSNGITDGDAFGDEATFSSASLAALVAPGADEPLDFNLNSGVSGNVVTTGGAGVLSQGANVIWGTNAGALVGFVNLGGGAGFDLGIDREVFRITDNGNGTFTFDLKDQLDHTPAAGDDGILTLDLTSAFSATDYDGDAVALTPDSITVVVENDVPAGVVSGSVSIRVEEDELSTGSGDLSNGITDGDAFGDEATFSTASFGAVVTPGADENVKFALNLGVSGTNVVTTGGATILSQGATVLWGTNAGGLVGFVNLGGGAGFDLGIDREVFRVTDNGNGTFTFDLKDQIDHASAAGDDGILTLDLSAAFGVTDFDGDAVPLASGSITVVVENDIPQVVTTATASIRVEEDELSTGSGDLSNGITDGDAFGDEATFSTASLAALVTPGADEPLDFNLNTALSGNVVTTGGAAVLSQGANVLWGTNAGALVGFVNLGGGAGFDLGIDREVFRVTDNGNGTFTFDLKDQLDHAAAAGDNGILTLDLTSAFSATDYDGDAVTLNADSITVVVENDVPAAAGSATASVRVEEDELSTGSGDLSNGITDGDAFGDEATFSTASLAALATPGADEPLDFNLNSGVSGNVVTTGGAAVLSQGANVLWGTNAGALVGFVNLGGGAGFDLGIDREVFRVTDNGNGTFTFDLKDQLDHAAAAGDNGILTLDLTSAFSATDFDGDAVTLNPDSITVVVENDVPQPVTSATASVRVEEDELSTGSGDLSNGITDGDAFGDEATFSSASLAALVAPGADEPLDFNLNSGVSGNVVTTGGAGVLSQGANVIWGTNAGALVGFVNLGGGAGFDLGIDREVFRITDNGNGTFTFDLKDQLDHTPAAGDDGILTLDLTSAFSATDYDGDAVALTPDSITVVVENDVPAGVVSGSVSIRVEEDELSTGSGDLSNGITDGDAFGDEATFSSASLAALVTPGADEPLDFNLNSGVSGNVVTTGGAAVLSQGANVIWGTNAGALVGFVNLGGGAGFDLGIDREVFRVTDNGNGTFTFDLKDQLDHAAASTDTGILTLDLTGAFTATDFDGDAVTLNTDSITVVVENDVPSAAGSATASVRVEEDELSTGSGDLSNGITDGDAFGDEATFSSASLAALVTPGADEPIDFNLKVTAINGTNVQTTAGANVLSQGVAVKYLSLNANTLIGFADTNGNGSQDGGEREVFRVTDNGNGTFTFDLKDQLDHAAGGDLSTLSLDLTGAFTATDFDGDAVTLNADSITVVVENDIPDAENDSNSASEGGPAVIGNVLTNDAFGADEGTVGANVRVSHIESDNVPANESNIGSGGNAVIAGQFGSLTLNANGSYSYTPNGSIAGTGVDVFTYTLIDADGDTTTATLSITVDEVDLFPDAVQDNGTAPEGGQTVNAAFVLDFSASISDSELNQQLDAVRAAGQAIFAAGQALITIIIFSSTAAEKGTFTDFASFEAAVNGMNPSESGGQRPGGIGQFTDFTAGIELTMDTYVPLASTNNQVFFISDGNPNEQTGTGGNSLADATRTAWINFVNANDINVTAIGVGDNIQIARLQDVDVDGTGVPILVDDFDDLLDTLLDVVGGGTSGNVLSNDTPGDGAFQIVSITVDGVTYTYNGANITPSNGTPVIPGSVLDVPTALGGNLTFHFATGGGFNIGDWSYEAPSNIPGTLPVDETFTYVIRDVDGDLDSANLVVTVTQSDAGQIIMGTEYAIYFTISGDDQSFGGLSDADEEEIFRFDGETFIEYYNGGELGFNEEDIDALHVFQSGAFRFSIAEDNQTFLGVADGDNEDIFALDGPLDTSFTEVTFTPGDGGSTWGENDINALYQYANGNLIISFAAATNPPDASGTIYQPYELVLYNPTTQTFSEFANGMLTSGVIDAVHVLSNGNVIFSMESSINLGGVDYDDSDLIRWNGSSYSMYFDASAYGLTEGSEDIDGVSINEGNDILVGTAADDILIGLGGADTLTGGSGDDIFVLTDASAADTITDYASGDAVDLSALLDQALIEGGTQGTLANYVRLTNSGPDRVLQIDANGTAGGASFTTVAVFSPTQPATIHILYDNAEANVPQT